MRKHLYIKYSNERSRKFAVKTEILEDNDVRVVRKSALYPEGSAHIQNLLRWYEELSQKYQDIGIQVNRCSKDGDAVLLEYLQGTTLEEHLDELLLEGKVQEAKQMLLEYLERLHGLHKSKPFILTEKFFEVFGRNTGIETIMEQMEFQSGTVTDIDLVCANVILGEESVILDYEWTFDFPIPGLFLVYRVMHYYLDTHPLRKSLNKKEFLEIFGLREEIIQIFDQMEMAFQRYIEGASVPVRELYSSISPGIQESSLEEHKFQVYFGIHGEITEINSVTIPVLDGKVNCNISIPKECSFLRIDPYDKPCIAEFLHVSFDDKKTKIEGIPLNQARLEDSWGYFAEEDPAVTDIKVPENAKTLQVSLQVYEMKKEAVQQIILQLSEKERLEQKVERQAQKLYEIKNTKIWKLYQSYRNVVERKKK